MRRTAILEEGAEGVGHCNWDPRVILLGSRLNWPRTRAVQSGSW